MTYTISLSIIKAGDVDMSNTAEVDDFKNNSGNTGACTFGKCWWFWIPELRKRKRVDSAGSEYHFELFWLMYSITLSTYKGK